MKDKRGRTGLHLAAASGHYDMVALLLGQGSDINTFDKVTLSFEIISGMLILRDLSSNGIKNNSLAVIDINILNSL